MNTTLIFSIVCSSIMVLLILLDSGLLKQTSNLIRWIKSTIIFNSYWFVKGFKKDMNIDFIKESTLIAKKAIIRYEVIQCGEKNCYK